MAENGDKPLDPLVMKQILEIFDAMMKQAIKKGMTQEEVIAMFFEEMRKAYGEEG